MGNTMSRKADHWGDYDDFAAARPAISLAGHPVSDTSTFFGTEGR
jgi:hypothetical protein